MFKNKYGNKLNTWTFSNQRWWQVSAESKHFLPAILVTHVISPYRIYTVYSDRPEQTVQTQIIRHRTRPLFKIYTLCHSIITTFRHFIKLPSGLYGRCIFAWLLTQLWLIALLPSLIARRWVGPQTKWRLPPQSISDGRCLAIYVCGRTLRGPVYGFLEFWLQSGIDPLALFHHGVFDYTVNPLYTDTRYNDNFVIMTILMSQNLSSGGDS